jgi:hypothetical protein
MYFLRLHKKIEQRLMIDGAISCRVQSVRIVANYKCPVPPECAACLKLQEVAFKALEAEEAAKTLSV